MEGLKRHPSMGRMIVMSSARVLKDAKNEDDFMPSRKIMRRNSSIESLGTVPESKQLRRSSSNSRMEMLAEDAQGKVKQWIVESKADEKASEKVPVDSKMVGSHCNGVEAVNDKAAEIAEIAVEGDAEEEGEVGFRPKHKMAVNRGVKEKDTNLNFRMSKFILLKKNASSFQRPSILHGANRVAGNIFMGLSTRQFVSYGLAMLAMVNEAVLPTPKYNFPIAAVLTQLDDRAVSGKYVLTGMCMTTLIDLFWLMRPKEASYGAYFGSGFVSYFKLTLTGCVVLKLWLIFSVYFYLHPESDTPKKYKSRLWTSWKFFFPRQTLPRRENLSYEVVMRVVAILWIHAIGGIALLILAFITMTQYTQRYRIQNVLFGIPLHLIMLIKATSTFITLAIASGNVQWRGCLRVYGCLSLPFVSRDKRQPKRKPIVKYQKSWAKRIQFFKIADVIIGAYMALVLYSTTHDTVHLPFGMVFAIGITQILGILLDVWSSLLILVVYRCAKVLHSIYKTDEHEDIDVYMPKQLDHIYDEDDSDSSGSEDESDRSSEASDTEDQPIKVLLEPSAMNEHGTWDRHYDSYGRAYLMDPVTGFSCWDWEVDAETTQLYYDCGFNLPGALSTENYISYNRFNSMWDRYDTVGNFSCTIPTIPTLEDLASHLSYNRFWVIGDHVSENYHSVYFFATLAEENRAFLAELVFDHSISELHVTFKCQARSDMNIFVQLIKLKEIIGDHHQRN